MLEVGTKVVHNITGHKGVVVSTPSTVPDTNSILFPKLGKVCFNQVDSVVTVVKPPAKVINVGDGQPFNPTNVFLISHTVARWIPYVFATDPMYNDLAGKTTSQNRSEDTIKTDLIQEAKDWLLEHPGFVKICRAIIAHGQAKVSIQQAVETYRYNPLLDENSALSEEIKSIKKEAITQKQAEHEHFS